MEGRVKGDQGVSLEATGAVTTGNLIYLMSSWLHFRPHSGLRRTQKRTVHFPLHVHSGPLLFLFFFFFSYKAQAHICLTGITGAGNPPQLNLLKKGGRAVPPT